ncbi:uncharacterized protein isoform X1 [Rhodnius prolixus]|uniref:uncharacterized protein isoform X1 n=2 Tax=Rhodnius prolixus TaxID=13249 RepID=UPI003D18AA87
MNNTKAKLHIVLSAKSALAEFKCPTCKKIFISSHHLRCHFVRRHLQEKVVNYMKGSLNRDSQQERRGTTGVLTTSRRIEQLLKNLSIEELKIFDNDSSSPQENVLNVIEPYLSVLDPVTCYVNYLDFKADEMSLSSNLKAIEGHSEFSQFRRHINTEFNALQDGTLEETSKQRVFANKNAVCLRRSKSTNVDPAFFVSEQIIMEGNKHRNYVTNTSQREVIFTIKKESAETDRQLNDSLLQDDKSANSCAALVSAENENDSLIKTIHVSSQTEELVVSKDGDHVKEHYRKKVTNKDDYQLGNSKYESVPLDEAIQDTKSFDIIEVKIGENITVSGDTSSEKCYNSNEISESRIVDHNNKDSSNKERYNRCFMKVKSALHSRLRDAGVDPSWTTITDSVSEKTNSVLGNRRVNLCKEIPGFMTMRAMLDNTVEQILQGRGKKSSTML